MEPTRLPREQVPVAQTSTPRDERVISTKELLAGAHRVWIEHATQRYLLQVTRSGKLILTK